MHFRLAITLAYKNLLRNKIRNGLTGLTICLSVFILILGNGFIDGIDEATIRSQENVIGGSILLRPNNYPSDGRNFPLAKMQPLNDEVLQLVKSEEVQTWTTRIWSVANIIQGDTKIKIKLLGYAPERDPLVFARDRWRITGNWPIEDEQVMLSEHLAELLSLKTGDGIVIKGQTMPGSVNAMDFTVTGTVKTNNVIADGYVVWMPIKTASNFLLSNDYVNQISLKLSENASPENFKKTVNTTTWKANTARDELAAVLKINEFRRRAIGFISLALMLIAATGIANTIIMATYERIPEIGILRALGMTKPTVFSMFLLEGIGLGLVGGSFGAVFGGLVNYHFNKVGIDLTSTFEGLGDLPFPTYMYTDFSQKMIFMAICFGIIASTLASLWPAYQGLKIEPSIAIKEE